MTGHLRNIHNSVQYVADSVLLSMRESAALILMVLTFLVSGCVATAFKPTSAEDKDPANSFDGEWRVEIKEAGGVQYGPGNWVFNCDGKAGEFTLMVKDSLAKMPFRNKLHDAYVSGSGMFRFEIPLEAEARASDLSDSSLNRGQMTLIVTGSLAKQQGLLVWGVAEFANDGCKSKLAMAKL